MSHRLPCRLWVLFVAAGLAACGGGSSDDPPPATAASSEPEASSAPAPAPAPAPAAAPTPAPPVSTGSTCGIASFSATALARINQLRAAGADCGSRGTFPAAAALTWSAALTQASEEHTQDMVANDFFSHTGSNGSTLATRINATGYAASSIGENIAAGYPGLEAVLNGWITSPGHCANLMNPNFNQVGLVCVAGTASTTYNNYWTMDLAKSR